MVVPLRPEEVPNDVICSICMAVPQIPAITPCEHVFCKECIDRSLSGHQAVCPIDRSPCSQSQVRLLKDGSFVHRIWSSVTVKCEQDEAGCSWTGSIADYASHLENCAKSRNQWQGDMINSLHEQIENLEAEIRRVQTENTELRSDRLALNVLRNDHLRMMDQLSHEKSANERLRTENEALRSENVKLRKASERHTQESRPLTNSTGGYAYDRNNVIQLSQLIARNLENKPGYIDSNRVFNCVRNCYLDLKKGYGDNPQYYYSDMRMLLATCKASTWFTDRQGGHINNWLRERGWN